MAAEQTVERLRRMMHEDEVDGLAHSLLARADVREVLAVVEAAQETAGKQRDALGIIQQNFVFEDIGKEPGNWQHLAFTLYTMLCEIDAKLTPLLDDLHTQASDERKP